MPAGLGHVPAPAPITTRYSHPYSQAKPTARHGALHQERWAATAAGATATVPPQGTATPAGGSVPEDGQPWLDTGKKHHLPELVVTNGMVSSITASQGCGDATVPPTLSTSHLFRGVISSAPSSRPRDPAAARNGISSWGLHRQTPGLD